MLEARFWHGEHNTALNVLRATIPELARGCDAVNPEAVPPVMYIPSTFHPVGLTFMPTELLLQSSAKVHGFHAPFYMEHDL